MNYDDEKTSAEWLTERQHAEWAAARASIRRDALDEAANVCERMVVGGRAWTDEQRIAGEALLAAATNIRALKGAL